ncbi:MAG: DUF1924 domain-containing protein [Burkholderiales bacterium]
MTAKKIALALLLSAAASLAHAETPQSLLAGYAAEAARAAPGFTPSPQRGRDFFQHRWGVSQKMPNCAACHTSNPSADGKHSITGKHIAPLSPRASPERFTRRDKVEKWFRRNCNDVAGRECSAAEKADFIQFLLLGVKS